MTQHHPAPCFLIGVERSGTTWLQRLLQCHPAVCGGEESHFFSLFGHQGYAKYWGELEHRPIGPLAYVDAEKFHGILKSLWLSLFEDLYADNPLAHVHLEKTPAHTIRLKEVFGLFPEAKVILLVRDARAVTASHLYAASTEWGKDWAAGSAYEAATRWYSWNKAALSWHRQHPENPFLILRYEDALANPASTLEKTLNFILPPDVDADVEQTLARYEVQQQQNTDPDGFVRKRGKSGWKADLSNWQKLVVWRYTRRMMRSFGYSLGPFH